MTCADYIGALLVKAIARGATSVPVFSSSEPPSLETIKHEEEELKSAFDSMLIKRHGSPNGALSLSLIHI